MKQLKNEQSIGHNNQVEQERKANELYLFSDFFSREPMTRVYPVTVTNITKKSPKPNITLKKDHIY